MFWKCDRRSIMLYTVTLPHDVISEEGAVRVTFMCIGRKAEIYRFSIRKREQIRKRVAEV